MHHSFNSTSDKSSKRNREGAFLCSLNQELLSSSDKNLCRIHPCLPVRNSCLLCRNSTGAATSLSSADTNWSCCPPNRWKQSINGCTLVRPEIAAALIIFERSTSICTGHQHLLPLFIAANSARDRLHFFSFSQILFKQLLRKKKCQETSGNFWKLSP